MDEDNSSVVPPQNPSEFTYTEGREFTSEIFKIEIKNVPQFSFAELKKLMKLKLNLNPVKLKAPGGRCKHVFACFRNVEEREEAIEKLNNFKWKGKILAACPAKAVADPFIKKRQEMENRSDVKVAKSAREATAPLAHLPYEEQIKTKTDEIVALLRNFGNTAGKTNFEYKKIIKENKEKFNGMPFEWEGLQPSPVQNEYRNKCEFSIGKNKAGEKVVGFRLGSYADGSVDVSDLNEVPFVPHQMKNAAEAFEEFVRASSLEIFRPQLNAGVYNSLGARYSSSSGEIMLIVGIQTKELSAEQIKTFEDDLLNFFTTGNGSKINLSSLYIQKTLRHESGKKDIDLKHLHGTEYITDEILGLKFRISPEAFFQVNTKGAEVLYTTAMQFANLNSNTSLLDICCGTGTIGLCLAKQCKRVLGVEIIPAAIEDAKFNATANDIENCVFQCGNADDHIDSLIRTAREDGSDVVAIVDPPRAGLHKRSIQAIRNARGLERFVYISCSPKSAMQNWIDLCRPVSKAYRGLPFIVTRASAVDMFPHTSHVELVLLFERFKQEQNNDKD